MTVLQERTTPVEPMHAELALLVKRLGNSISPLLLRRSQRLFRLSQVDGGIGYRLLGSCALVIGDPLCLPQDMPALVQAFHLYCQQPGWSIVYFLASEQFAKWASDHVCRTSIQVGEEIILDPVHFHARQKLRWKVHQSYQHGVVIKEYRNDDAALEMQLQGVIDRWVKGKHGAQLYLGEPNLFVDQAHRRLFYALQGDEIVGLLLLAPIDKWQGWAITSFLAVPGAPAGITEHLVSHVSSLLAHEGCAFLCLGFVAGDRLGEMKGVDRFRQFCMRFIFTLARKLFRLDARKIYLNKYHPSTRPTYVLCSGKLRFRELMALKKTLSVRL